MLQQKRDTNKMNKKALLHTLKMQQARPNTEHTNKLSSVHARAQVELQRREGAKGE